MAYRTPPLIKAQERGEVPLQSHPIPKFYILEMDGTEDGERHFPLFWAFWDVEYKW